MKRLTIHSSSYPPTKSAAATSHRRPLIPFSPRPYALQFRSTQIVHSPKFTNKFLLYSSLHHHQMATTISDESTPSSSPTVIHLKPIEATPESFEEFGQVVEVSADGEEFGPLDAQLDLSRGIPRFYIMRLEGRPLKFSNITHHSLVTQCLGSVGSHVWYVGVAKPSIVDPSEVKSTGAVQSRQGHFYIPPAVEDVRVFRVSGPKFLKLNVGTWHAGPLFLENSMNFYNLELSNTNVVDHTTHSFAKKDNVIFTFDK